jgi:hypothetical protein
LKKQKVKKAGAKKAEEAEALTEPTQADEAIVDSKAAEDSNKSNVISQEKDESKPDGGTSDTTRSAHNRQPSLSLQSKLRSSSFRKGSLSQPALSPTSANLKSPNLPLLSPEGDAVTEIYRKQGQRIEELERENKRLEKDFDDGEVRWRKTEEEVEELREGRGDSIGLRDKANEFKKEVKRLVCYCQVLLWQEPS